MNDNMETLMKLYFDATKRLDDAYKSQNNDVFKCISGFVVILGLSRFNQEELFGVEWIYLFIPIIIIFIGYRFSIISRKTFLLSIYCKNIENKISNSIDCDFELWETFYINQAYHNKFMIHRITPIISILMLALPALISFTKIYQKIICFGTLYIIIFSILFALYLILSFVILLSCIDNFYLDNDLEHNILIKMKNKINDFFK